MKLSIMSAIILTATCVAQVQEGVAQGLQFENKWEQAVEKATLENKLIFVDFYADWCGPCRYLEKEVFPQEEVGAYFNENYISVRVDAEKEEQALVKKMNIQAYPTLVFYSPGQEIIYRQEGALSAEELVTLGKQVKKFNSLGENPALEQMSQVDLKDYLIILKAQDFDRAKNIAEGFLDKVEGPDLQQDFNLFLLTTFVQDFDHKHFQYLLNHMDSFSAQEERITPYISSLLDKFVSMAITNRRLDFMDQYAALHAAYAQTFEEEPKELDFYLLKGKAVYYLETAQPDRGKELYQKLVEKYYFQNIADLTNALLLWLDLMDTEEERKTALKWAQQAYRQEKSFSTSYLLAHTLKEFDKANALTYAKEALALADTDDNKEWAREQVEELSSK